MNRPPKRKDERRVFLFPFFSLRICHRVCVSYEGATTQPLPITRLIIRGRAETHIFPYIFLFERDKNIFPPLASSSYFWEYLIYATTSKRKKREEGGGLRSDIRPTACFYAPLSPV